MDVIEFLLLAIRELQTNKVRELLTMLVIIIGVASVILLVCIGKGRKEYITKTF